MTGPTRLLEHPRPAVRDLLRAGVAEQPSRAALQRTATALGVSASVVSAAASASAGATLAAVAPNALVVVGKWLAIGTLAGLGLAAGASTLTSNPRRSAQALPSAGAMSNVSATASPEPALATDAPIATPPATSPPKVALLSKTLPNSSPPAAGAPLPSNGELPEAQDLAREVATIDRARAMLATDNAAEASRALDDYASRPRTGTLEREAQLLRIDLLLLQGNRSAARALARRYTESFPKDPRVARFRALLEQP